MSLSPTVIARRLCCLALYLLLTVIPVSAQEKKHIISGAGWPADTATVNAVIRRADQLDLKQYPDSVFALYYEAYRMAKDMQYHRALVYTLCKMGDIYFNHKKRYPQSKATLYQVLPHLPELSRKDQQRFVPMTYNLLANALFMNAQYDSAIHYYSLALNAMENLSVDNPKVMTEIYSNMGAVLSASGQYAKGIHYLKKTLTVAGIDSAELAKNYGNLGALYANFIHDMDSATYWWYHAIALYKKLSMVKELQQVYTNIGTGWALLYHQDMVKAQRYFDTAWNTSPATANENISLLQGFGATNYYNGNYEAAIRYALQSLDIAVATGDKEKEQYVYWTLSYCYAHLGDATKTHFYQKRLAFLDDTLRNEKITRSISEAESKYQLFEKNNELIRNKARLYRQQLWLTASVAGGVLLAGILLGVVLYIRQKQRLQLGRIRNMEQQQQIDNLQVKMEAEEQERARIARELHDGLGVLLSAAKINHNLLGKALPPELRQHNAYGESGEIITQIYSELRSVTQNLLPDYIVHKSLEDALGLLIAKLDTPGFPISLQAYGDRQEIHPETSFAIYRAIEEIVNNAVRHSGGSELIIQLLYHEDRLHITTEDNGSGFDTGKNYLGLGLGNIERRVRKVGGFITLSSAPGQGTTYLMEIPY